jgi:hypothetical protein
VRQGGAVDPLGGQHVDVVGLGELLGGEGLGRAEDHVPGVVDDGVQPPGLVDDLLDRRVDHRLAGDVHRDRVQVSRVGPGVRIELGGGGGVGSGGIAHPGVDGVAGVREGARGQRAEPARGAGDDDALGHDDAPEGQFWRAGGCRPVRRVAPRRAR